MHVLLVGPDLEENLSLRYLSSALMAAGHTATIATFDSLADRPRVLELARKADLVGLSMCYQIRALEFLELARDLKQDKPNRAIVAGGHYASCTAHELLAHHPELDLIVIHEGERTLVELASLSDRGPDALAGVRGIVYRSGDSTTATPARAILGDLDTLPWPDRTGPARLLAGVPTAYMMGSRGCLGACDYCCISTLHRLVPGRRFRQRRPERIADEMAWLYHERGVRQFVFHDDNFLVPSVERNLERIDTLERALRSRGVRHIGLALKCRPGDVDRQVFRRLRAMGLLRVFLGIESGTPEGLASIGRRQTVAEQHRALGICEELDISTQYTIILFHPEATPATMLTDLAFVRQHLAHPLSFCRAEIYSGTPLEQRMISAGRACGGYLARTYRYTEPKTALVWAMGADLLRPRCWSQTHLLGQVVRLDHLATVFRDFYDGRDVDALAADFFALELEINRDTVDLLEELIRACDEYPSAESLELRARLETIAERERTSRDRFQQRLCDLREALHARAFDLVGLPRPGSVARPVGRTLGGLPRHAAAAFLAAGLLGCGGDDEPSHKADAGVTGGQSNDSGVVDASVTGGSYSNDGGMFEAPPPPMDSGVGGLLDAGTGGSSSTGGVTASTGGRFISDGGMFEAPPPPMDSGVGGYFATGGSSSETGGAGASSGAGGVEAGAGGEGGAGTGGNYVSDGGMFEAPPPPLDEQ
jgi:anaerobic magnesium-protoporphyrin IX monomethyl ester cyclase